MKLVLVVEDEYGNAEVLQLLLESEGYRVVVAANGRAGLELLSGEKPAVILSDFMMPYFTGAELGRAVRSDPLLRDIPFIMMSATSESVIQAFFNDYDAFLAKPCSTEDLLKLVSHMVVNGRPRRQQDASVEASLRVLLRGVTLPPRS